MMKVEMGYPTADEEVTILERHLERPLHAGLEQVQPVITQEELLLLRQMLWQVHIDPSLLHYIVLIAQQTRQSKDIFLGASPRASVAMLQASRAYALLQGRDFVAPDDIKQVAPAVLAHRLMLTAEAEMEELTPRRVVMRLIDQVEVPK